MSDGPNDFRVLVVEDEPGVRDFVKRGLISGGYTVSAAEDGQQALEMLEAETFDLMITDIVMPGIDGIALALKAAKEYPSLKILLMTGYATERQRAHNLEALVHTVLAKPFSLKALLTAAEQALASRRMN